VKIVLDTNVFVWGIFFGSLQGIILEVVSPREFVDQYLQADI
jgi:hypothetical protein